jgi:hypothetical protein
MACGYLGIFRKPLLRSRPDERMLTVTVMSLMFYSTDVDTFQL